jgi:NAD(P)-dependent dehydrogenase (short-subunit alcohol dehydrogenase family)
MQFAGKTAFITGGGRGIGETFGKALAAEGAAIVIAELNLAAGQRVAAEIEAAGGKAIAVECDASDEPAVKAAVAKGIETFGGIDILINNAGLHGYAYGQPITKLSADTWRRLLDVNVVGIVICSAAVRESMASRGGGVIVNLSSTASMPAATAYGVSKLAVRGLTVGLAQEFGAEGIRVYAIAPGLMNTPGVDDLPQNIKDHLINNMQLIKRPGVVEDLVGTLKFFCSDAASFITGETLVVGGGWPLRN